MRRLTHRYGERAALHSLSLSVPRGRFAVDPVHVAELARYDQEIACLNSADYGRSMREAFAVERRIVERLGLAPGAP